MLALDRFMFKSRLLLDYLDQKRVDDGERSLELNQGSTDALAPPTSPTLNSASSNHPSLKQVLTAIVAYASCLLEHLTRSDAQSFLSIAARVHAELKNTESMFVAAPR